jgi:hypothetical protein
MGEMKRRAYILLRRFREMENIWLVFLRARGFGDIGQDKKKRIAAIFTAMREQYHSEGFAANFLKETGRHFMAVK